MESGLFFLVTEFVIKVNIDCFPDESSNKISVSTCTSFIQLSSEAIGGAMWERSKIKGVRIGKEEIKPMYSQMA